MAVAARTLSRDKTLAARICLFSWSLLLLFLYPPPSPPPLRSGWHLSLSLLFSGATPCLRLVKHTSRLARLSSCEGLANLVLMSLTGFCSASSLRLLVECGRWVRRALDACSFTARQPSTSHILTAFLEQTTGSSSYSISYAFLHHILLNSSVNAFLKHIFWMRMWM